MTQMEHAVSSFAGWLYRWGALSAVLLLMAAAGGAAAWYGYQEIEQLKGRVSELDTALASATSTLSANIAQANAATRAALTAALEAQGQSVASVTDQVSTLEKLQSLDPQLLAKYSKVYFLNENYVPERLAEIPSEYRYFDDRPMQIIPEVLPRLEDMINAAKDDGATLYVDSAYRSFAEQKAIKGAYSVTYGAGTANSFSADQGYSEHQLGTTVDLITTGLNGQLIQAFDQTEAYSWLQSNAYKYGFALSYPKGNAYYIYEPWHWRYVGIKLATYLHKNKQYFYDLDQHTIDTYLINIFD